MELDVQEGNFTTHVNIVFTCNTRYDPRKMLINPAISNKFKPANNDPPRYNIERRSVHKATRVKEMKITDVAKNAVGTMLLKYYQ